MARRAESLTCLLRVTRIWLGEPIRPTKDVDLLGFGGTSAEALKRVFVELSAIASSDDGLTVLPGSVRVEAIREDQEYGGMRVKLMAMLGNVDPDVEGTVGVIVASCDDMHPAPIPRPALLQALQVEHLSPRVRPGHARARPLA